MGHLFSDESFEELYQFGVKKLKLKPQYNHYSRHLPHFDLTTKAIKERAVNLGAKKINSLRYALVYIKRAEVVFNKVLENERKIGATQRSLF
jgi:hypothetical protein